MLVGTLLLLRQGVQGRERILQPDGGDFNRKPKTLHFPLSFRARLQFFALGSFCAEEMGKGGNGQKEKKSGDKKKKKKGG